MTRTSRRSAQSGRWRPAPPVRVGGGCASGTVETPIGPLRIVASAEGIIAIEFTSDRGAATAPGLEETQAAERHVREAARQLHEYFSGRRDRFELPLRPSGTDFEERVWRELERIPAGRTRTYTEIAKAAGRPGAARAAGGAIGKNPIAIVIPCHRVIGSNGSLTGFGGGIERKRWLIDHESGQRPLAGTRLDPS